MTDNRSHPIECDCNQCRNVPPDYEGDNVPPHCDVSILHAPGVCDVCDLYPNWQALRTLWQINFTGEYDTEKAPCPSVYFREIGVRDAWGGNTPWKED